MEFTKIKLVPNDISCKMIFKKQQDKNNNTEQIYISNLSTEEVVYSFEENRVGTSLISFLNNYDKIINEFEKYIYKYENTIKFDFESLHTYMKELENNLLKIFDEARIIGITLNEFLCDMRYDHEKEKYNFYLENYHEKISNNNRYDFEEMSISYSSIRNYKNFEDDNTFYKKLWIRFLKQYKDLLKNLKSQLDISFISKKDKSNYTKKFNGTPALLPPTEVFYEEGVPSNYLETVEHRYYINNFSDFIYSSLHSIFISKKVISKCKRCKKYFITCKDNDEIYCPNLNENGFFTELKEATENGEGYKMVVDSDCRRKATEERTNNNIAGKKSKFKDKRIMEKKGQIMDRLGRKKKNGELIYGDLKQEFINEFDKKVEMLDKKYLNNIEEKEKELLEFMISKDNVYRKRKED